MRRSIVQMGYWIISALHLLLNFRFHYLRVKHFHFKPYEHSFESLFLYMVFLSSLKTFYKIGPCSSSNSNLNNKQTSWTYTKTKKNMKNYSSCQEAKLIPRSIVFKSKPKTCLPFTNTHIEMPEYEQNQNEIC